MLIKII